MSTPSIFDLNKTSETIITKDQVKKEVEEYDALFDDPKNVEKRKSQYMTIVNNFYDLVTGKISLFKNSKHLVKEDKELSGHSIQNKQKNKLTLSFFFKLIA